MWSRMPQVVQSETLANSWERHSTDKAVISRQTRLKKDHHNAVIEVCKVIDSDILQRQKVIKSLNSFKHID